MITYSIAPSLSVREEEYIFTRLYSAARHLRAAHPAHQYVDKHGRVYDLVQPWNALSGLGIFAAYRAALSEIHLRWLNSQLSHGPENHHTIAAYRAFVNTTAPRALAYVVHKYYGNYSAMRFPYELDLSYKLPYNLEVKDFCMAVIYECVQGIEYRPFTLLNGYAFTWSVMTAGILSTIYLATQDDIYTRWMNGDLTVRSYDDLDRATLRVLTAKVLEEMNRRVKPDGSVDMSNSPHQQILQPSEGNRGGLTRGGSPSFVADTYDPTHNMSL
ncbi:hypothetical protein D9619_003751 [Psilocybe cf. subviscida]|uniref:Uncharacterized protein n=1 Tax=Psilocybe cf. subviscida TaxID=2480587 RepID=A0A8H5AYP1_9AGAR|nr:hypothetical protein D9619_003751 [Psilocybe cf. subviscida]